MHTLLLTLTLLMASPDPARDALLARFDAARARLATADRATLERAVVWLETSAGSTAAPDRTKDHGSRKRDDGTCLARVMDRYVRAHNGVEYAARTAQKACAEVDADLLVDLIDAFVADHNGLEYATRRAREVALGLDHMAEPFQVVLRALREDHNGLDYAVRRTRDLLAPLTPSGARCVVQTFPVFVRDHNGLEYSLRRAAETCARP